MPSNVFEYGLDVPTSVAVNSVTFNGSKKLSCAEDLIPFRGPTILYFSF